MATVDELLTADFTAGKHLILEVKHGAYFAAQGFPVSAILARKLRELNWRERGITLTLESFDFKVLEQMQRVCGDVGEYVFLVDTWGEPRFDKTAKIFDGISFNSVLVFDSDWIDQAQARGLKVFVWTARAEEAEASTDEYFAKFVLSGADGVFTDHPDLLIEVANGLEHA